MNVNSHSAGFTVHPTRAVPAAWLTAAIVVDASQRLDTPAGRLLRKMYYGPFIDETLSRGESSGYPNNGSEHTLTLRLTPSDLLAFLELVEERFVRNEGVAEFVNSVLNRAEKKYPHLRDAFAARRRLNS